MYLIQSCIKLYRNKVRKNIKLTKELYNLVSQDYNSIKNSYKSALNKLSTKGLASVFFTDITADDQFVIGKPIYTLENVHFGEKGATLLKMASKLRQTDEISLYRSCWKRPEVRWKRLILKFSKKKISKFLQLFLCENFP